MRTKKSSINIVVSIICLLITTIFGIVLSKFFIQYIGIEKNGLNSLFYNTLAILSISELGIAGAINYNLYKPVHEKNYSKIASIMKFYKKCYRIIGVIILVLSGIVSFFIGDFVSNTSLSVRYIQISFLIYSINCASTYFLAYNRNLFYGFQNVYVTSIIDFIVKVFKNTIQIILIIKYHNFILFLLLNVIFDFLSNAIIHIYAKKVYNYIDIKNANSDKSLEKKVINDVKSLSVIQITNAFINFTDTIIISKFVGIIQTGFYANYKLIVTQLVNAINTIFNSLGSSIGNLLAENNKTKIKNALFNLQYFCFMLGVIFMNGLACLSQPFVRLWLGQEYLIRNAIVLILSINIYLTIQRQVITYFLRTGGYHNKMIKPAIIECIINLSLSLYLVFKYDILGVLIGTTISLIYGLITTSNILYKEFNFDYRKYLIRQLIMLIFTFSIGIVLTYISINLHYSIFMNFIVSLIIYLVLVFIIILMLLLFDKNLKFYKDLISNNIKKILKRA